MNSYPHQQAFNKERAVSAMAERISNNANTPINLARRIKDYQMMVKDPKFDVLSVRKPGSNKKWKEHCKMKFDNAFLTKASTVGMQFTDKGITYTAYTDKNGKLMLSEHASDKQKVVMQAIYRKRLPQYMPKKAL